MKFKVVNTFPMSGVDFGEDLLKPFGTRLITIMSRTEEEIIENGKDADAVIGSASLQPLSRRVLGALSRCRIFASHGIGLDQADLEAATDYGIVITNTPDSSLDEVSGRVLAFMLALGHRLFQLHRGVRENQFHYLLDHSARMSTAYPIFRMRDQTLGIVGFGRIGTAAAIKANGLGMRVIAYDPYVPQGVIESRGAKSVDFETLLKESDFISVNTVLTEETHNMFSFEDYKKMKPTCYLINTARGGCINQDALIQALKEKLIAGAGIDVTVDEPIAKNNPLLEMDNVILTGHSAGYSTFAESDLFRKPMTQVVKVFDGEWPPYAVNPEVRKKWLDKWGNTRKQ